MRSKLKTAEKKIDYLKLKIQESILRLGITVDNELDEGLGLKHTPTIKGELKSFF